MGTFSIWHWIIVVFFLTIPVGLILGVIRGVNDKSVLHAIFSLIIPWYGFFYFFIGRKR
jgi:hypothetical protein